LQEHCARHARWLGYVDFERIVDERNAAPEVFCSDRVGTTPGVHIFAGTSIWVPEDLVPALNAAMPHLSCRSDSPPRSPYRIVLIGEKVSLRPILVPIAERVGGEVILPTGEMSDTLIYGMTVRAAEDGRPTICMYCSDFDPSGFHMPVTVSRKVQALCDLRFPGLDISVHPVALTYDQVVDLDLPSTPLKEGERRADKWQAYWGRAQTEIDALAALQPNVLSEIIEEAIKPFYDATLERRWRRAETAWAISAMQQLRENPKYAEAEATVAAALKDAEIALDEMHEAADALDDAQQ